MIKRLYADNFRCLVNFEIELDETNLFLSFRLDAVGIWGAE